MPVVLYEAGGVARSGHLYGDRTGIEYEYPAGRYENWISRGDRFVYAAPGRYFGCGVIGEIRASPKPGRLICDVLSVELFDAPVSLKDQSGSYFEADTTYWQGVPYWGQGVRPLSNERFDAILQASRPSDQAGEDASEPTYASADTARKVEDVAVAAAVDLMKQRFGCSVTVMPRNNPGFDLRVGSAADPLRFVEVKGTQSSQPVFFMSEGEREFSHSMSGKYTLVVVTGIDHSAGTHEEAIVRDGSVAGADVTLRPSQWRGRLSSHR